jgi:electron transfer flavoprotein beta subunit
MEILPSWTEMAEHLNIPQVTGALKIVKDGEKLLVDRDNESSSQTIAVESRLWLL